MLHTGFTKTSKRILSRPRNRGAGGNSLLCMEYQYLYDEIRGNSQISANVFTISITATATIIGYGISSGIWGIFLAPFVVLIPALFFIASQMESTIKNAAYIAVFIEPDDDFINWENHWLALRARGLIPSNPMGRYSLSVSGLFGLVFFLCLALAWVYISPKNSQNIIILSSITIVTGILLVIVVRSLHVIFTPGFAQKYVEAWQKLKDSHGTAGRDAGTETGEQ